MVPRPKLSQKTKQAWLKDPAVYPLIGVMGLAVVVVGTAVRHQFHSPSALWNTEIRHGTNEEVNPTDTYYNHRVRKYVSHGYDTRVAAGFQNWLARKLHMQRSDEEDDATEQQPSAKH